jgi:type I restriction enzyme, S subunit
LSAYRSRDSLTPQSEWLRSVPKDWQIERLKWSVEGSYNGIWGSEPDGVDDITCVRVADFDRVRFKVIAAPTTLRAIEAKDRENRILRCGDLLIEKSGGGDRQPVGAVVDFDRNFEAVSSNFIARMSPSLGMHSRYWTYVHATLYAARLNIPAIKQTTGIQNLDLNAYLNQRVPYPPFSEQRLIAEYLDRETAHCDELIAAKERLLDLLREKRRAIIAHRVMRGLNAGPLRDSGIPWLGQIPAQWSVKRAKWLFKERDERSTSGEEVLLSLRMERGLVPHDEVSEKPIRSDDLIGYKKVAKGQIVINRMRAASGLIAVSPVDGLVSPDYAVFECESEVDQFYFTHLFRTELLQSIFRSESTGLGTGSSGFLRLYSENFLALWFPFPSLDEQRAIVGCIEKETNKLDALRLATQRTISLLKERKAALISAAVTGQIPAT